MKADLKITYRLEVYTSLGERIALFLTKREEHIPIIRDEARSLCSSLDSINRNSSPHYILYDERTRGGTSHDESL